MLDMCNALSFTPSASLSASAVKAVKRSEEEGPLIFTGAEALTEVANTDGDWDWALVGPDPAELPLSGGGSGGVEEIREAMGKHAHSFGLLRLEFFQRSVKQTRFIFIHASDDHAGKFSVRERGQAGMMKGRMAKIIGTFAPISAEVRFACEEDATMEYLLERLRTMLPVDTELFTMENFKKAQEQYNMKDKSSHNSRSQSRSSFISSTTRGKVRHWEILQVPRARLATADPDLPPDAVNGEPSGGTMRRKAKILKVGDVVEVYSVKQQKWVLDGEVRAVTKEFLVEDGFKIRAGSMKVVFANATRFKWVAPQNITEHIRPSPRVKPPPLKLGTMDLQVSSEEGTEWTTFHVEANRGFFQWWESEELARKGMRATGTAYLLGLQLFQEAAVLKLRSSATQGATYTFTAESEEEAQEWVTALWEHAGFCEEIKDFQEAKDAGTNVREELLALLGGRRGGA